MLFDSSEPRRAARGGHGVPACLVVSGVLVAVLWMASVTQSLDVPVTPPIALLLGTSLLLAASAYGGLSVASTETLVAAHLAVCFALTTVLIQFTGGFKSPYLVLYVLTILAASLARGVGAGVLFAAGSTLTLMTLGYAHGTYALLQGTTSGLTFLLVGVLAGHLAQEAHAKEERIATTASELARVQAASQRVMESVPVGIVTATVTGRITSINHAAAAILGIEEATQLLGFDLREYLGGLAPALVDSFESAAATGKWSVREEVVLGGGHEARPVGVAMTPVETSGEDGHGVEGVVLAITDLRELRRLEEEMLRSEQLATLGELAAGVAHEIRNPLASISGAVQVLRDEISGSGDEAELMSLIVKESERLNRIINGFLDYTRDHSRSTAAHDLSQTAREVVRLLQHDMTLAMGKTFLVEFPSDQDFRAMVEEEGIKQVFFNLARNALEAMQLGGILRITGESPGDGRIYVVFRDTGEGIAPHELEQVFKPFHTSKQGGTGLGLSIASRIVEGHGGSIRIRSTPGMGTAVTVELPVAKIPMDSAAPGSSFEEELPKEEEVTSAFAPHGAWPSDRLDT